MRKTLAIDFGESKIGVAISDDKGIIAQPLTIINRKSDTSAIEQLSEICRDQKVEQIVLGLPVSARTETISRINSFAKKLTTETKLELETWDETFSTKQAENVVGFSDVPASQIPGRKPTLRSGSKRARAAKRRDDVAAAIILQEYLDHENGA